MSRADTRRLSSHALDQCQERVHLATALVAVLAQRVRRARAAGLPGTTRRPNAAARRACAFVSRSAGRDSPPAASSARGRGAPHREPTPPLPVRSRIQSRSVRPPRKTSEMSSRAPHHARPVGFDPDGRFIVTDVAQERAQHQARGESVITPTDQPSPAARSSWWRNRPTSDPPCSGVLPSSARHS